MNAPVRTPTRRTATTALAVVSDDTDDLAAMFEPLRLDTLADLFAAYADDRERMTAIAAIFSDPASAAMVAHFVAANTDERGYVRTCGLFALAPALASLDADYWSRALDLTDVLEVMPQTRRDEWHEMIRTRKTPEFAAPLVVATIRDLLAQRHKFFAERVDGIFRRLSGEHVTNRPEGFSKRMIIAWVVDRIGFVCHSRSGTVNDLRSVIARFMGRDEPRTIDTLRAVEFCYRERRGQWVDFDGGALRMRVYGNGNAHLEVHPAIAWRLNGVLAFLYPTAIAETHRRRPHARAPREFAFYSRPLARPVLDRLADGRWHEGIFSLDYDAQTKPGYVDACGVLALLGGSPTSTGRTFNGFAFDYDAGDVIREVVISGTVPDERAHQFYPTHADLAARVVELADVGSAASILEPSAGHGALASLLPADRTTAIDVSPLHCKILQAKGIAAICVDFLKYSPGRRFARIVMNPPFTASQWQRHVEHAAELLAAGGRIVAVLPASAARSGILPGWRCTFTEPEPFPGTSIEVVVMVAERGQS